jgi:hypothetical protein
MLSRLIEPFFKLVDKVRTLSPTQRAGLMAHLLFPGLVFGIAIFFGGGLIFGLENGVAISELKTEIDVSGATSTKRGVVVIAETFSSQPKYLIPLNKVGSKIWSSLDETSARSNHQIGSLVLTARGPYVANELISDDNQPIAFVVEGELADYIEIPGNGKEAVADWRLAPRRSVYLIVGVLISCSLALGIGAVLGVPAVNPNQNNASQIRTEPDKD